MGFFEKLVADASGLDPDAPLNPLIADLTVKDDLKRAAMASLNRDERVYDAVSCVCNDKYGSTKFGWVVVVTENRLIMGNKHFSSVPWNWISASGLAASNPGLVLEITGSDATLNGRWLFVPDVPGVWEKGVSEADRHTRQRDRSQLLLASIREAHDVFAAAEGLRSAVVVENMAAELRRKRGF